MDFSASLFRSKIGRKLGEPARIFPRSRLGNFRTDNNRNYLVGKKTYQTKFEALSTKSETISNF